jgi:hypothetical protein
MQTVSSENASTATSSGTSYGCDNSAATVQTAHAMARTCRLHGARKPGPAITGARRYDGGTAMVQSGENALSSQRTGTKDLAPRVRFSRPRQGIPRGSTEEASARCSVDTPTAIAFAPGAVARSSLNVVPLRPFVARVWRRTCPEPSRARSSSGRRSSPRSLHSGRARPALPPAAHRRFNETSRPRSSGALQARRRCT